MKIIITGTGGSVGPHVVNKFSNEGWTVYPWNRNVVNPGNPKAVEEFVLGIQPDAIIHLATGSHNWTEQLSALSKKYGARFLYSSSVSVWSDSAPAPLTVDSAVDGDSEYAKYKYEGELRSLKVNPDAYIARLGWQISRDKTVNSMTRYLNELMEREGVIHCSTSWFPSCSFVEDTAAALYNIITDQNPGLFLVNSNENLNFYNIVEMVLREFPESVPGGKTDTSNPFSMDNRMFDARVKIRKFLSQD